jgi:hypothetical protein
VAKELTERQGQILDLKHGARWSLRQIARHLGLNYKTVHESYTSALSKVDALGLPKELPVNTTTRLEWRRFEEAEFIDARIRDYLDTYNEARKARQYRAAVEALNGCHRYMETMIKLQGLAAPERHEITLSVDMLEKELKRIEAEIGPIIEGEIEA